MRHERGGMGGGGGYTLALELWFDRLAISDPLERDSIEALLEAMEGEENAYQARRIKNRKGGGRYHGENGSDDEDLDAEIQHLTRFTTRFRKRHGLDRYS